MDPQDLAQDVLERPARAAHFVTMTVAPGAESEARDALGDIGGIVRSVGFRVPEARLTCVVGTGAEFWERAFAELPRPAHLHRLPEIAGERHTAVSTPGDLLFHIRCDRPDLAFSLAHRLVEAFRPLGTLTDEVVGFRFWDDRDLLGFVDGTENPTPAAAAAQAALVGQEDATWRGSSYVVVQKYLHDLDAWGALTTEQQEQAIGRTKLEDVEFPDAAKASNSHVALNTITDESGTPRKIVRDNLPFGSLGDEEFGTYFIGYAADPGVTEEMLRRMFIGVPKGNHDRILDFSRAVTGCLFFVPPFAFFENPQAFAASD